MRQTALQHHRLNKLELILLALGQAHVNRQTYTVCSQ
jgi:hypothetical protein